MGDYNYNKFDSIIFDVDGTLWDVRDAVAHAWRDVITQRRDRRNPDNPILTVRALELCSERRWILYFSIFIRTARKKNTRR